MTTSSRRPKRRDLLIGVLRVFRDFWSSTFTKSNCSPLVPASSVSVISIHFPFLFTQSFWFLAKCTSLNFFLVGFAFLVAPPFLVAGPCFLVVFFTVVFAAAFLVVFAAAFL